MPPQNTTCTLCTGTLQEGFLVDRGHMNGVTVGVWHAGAPVRSFWGGLKTTSVKERPIIACCCDQCGHIELFAKPRGG